MMQRSRVLSMALGLFLSGAGPVRSISYLSVCFSKDGKQLISAGVNCPIKVWDVATGIEVRRLAERSAWASPAIATPDGKVVATDEKGGVARLFPLAGDGETQALGQGVATIPWETLSSDGKLYAGPSRDRKFIVVVELASGKVLRKLLCTEMVWSSAFTPDGKSLVAAVYDRSIRVYDLVSGAMTVLSSPLEQCYSIAVSPDGKTVAAGSMGGTVSLWEAAKANQELRSMKHPGALTAVAFSPDGTKLASVSFGSTSRIWEVATGKELHALQGGQSTAAFSPDGKILATGGGADQPFIWLWDVESGKELRKLDAR